MNSNKSTTEEPRKDFHASTLIRVDLLHLWSIPTAMDFQQDPLPKTKGRNSVLTLSVFNDMRHRWFNPHRNGFLTRST